MSKLPLLIILPLLLSEITGAQHLYVSDINGNLSRLDIETCQRDHMCAFGVTLYDITYHPDGTLYGISPDGSLYELDTSACSAQFVFRFDAKQNFNSLSADAQGDIYAAGEAGAILWYNPSTGKSGTLGDIPFAASGDLTFYNGRMYAACTGDRIVEINRANPSESQVFMAPDLPDIVIGIAGYSERCGAIRTFIFTPSQVYELGFSNKTTHFLCSSTGNISGAASAFEFNGSYGLQVSASDATCNEPNGSVAASALGSIGPVAFSLDGGPFQEENVFAELTAGRHVVQSLDSLGCLLTDSVVVGAAKCPFYVPNAIRPGSASGNEAFTIYGAEQLVQTVKTARIYDRWGALVFDGSNGRMIVGDLNSGWDGTRNGRALPEGVYVYWIEIEMVGGEIVTFEGDITLLGE